MKKLNTISQENAKQVFIDMCNGFGFTIPEEAKEQRIEVALGEMNATIVNEVNNAKITIDKIASGIIEYNDNKGNPQIIYNLIRPIKLDGSVTNKFEFGLFPLKKAESLEKIVTIDEMTASMSAKKAKAVIMCMTGISDEDILGELELAQLNDLRSIVNYFLA